MRAHLIVALLAASCVGNDVPQDADTVPVKDTGTSGDSDDTVPVETDDSEDTGESDVPPPPVDTSDTSVDLLDSDLADSDENVDTHDPDDTACIPPVLGVSPLQWNVPEDAAYDMAVGALSFSAGTTRATLTGDGDGRVWLDVAGWHLRVRGGLDFETEPVVPLQVTTEGFCGARESFDIELIVTDVNEPPTVEQPTLIPIPEDLRTSLVLGDAVATDHEGGPLIWSLPAHADARFGVSATGQLVAEGEFDFETEPQISLDLLVHDSAGLQGSGSILVDIVDRNDAPTITSTTLSIGELSPPGTVIGQLEAVDPDGDAITWSPTHPHDTVLLASDGTLTVHGPLDHEDEDLHRMSVTATDSEGAAHSTWLDLEILDENEAPTAVGSTPSWTERDDRDSTFDHLVQDPDEGDSFTLTLLGEDPRFSIQGEVITFHGDLDFETEPQVRISYEVQDVAGLSDVGEIVIEVLDVDELPEALVGAPVPEDAAVGSTVSTLTVWDPEGDPVTISPATSGPFTVHADGTISVVSELDFEDRRSWTVAPRLSTPGGRSGPVFVDIEVADVNEPPILSFRQHPHGWSEDMPVGTTRGDFSAIDPEGEDLTWSVTGPFTVVDGNTVRLEAPLDHETTPILDILLRVEDPAGLAAEQSYTTSVADVDEPLTQMSLISDGVPENVPNDTVVGRLYAEDPEEQPIAWQLSPGTPFRIVGDELRTNGPMDYEAQSTYDLSVTAHQQTLDVQVVVLDVNEPPVISSSRVTIPEVGAPSPVHRLIAVDPEGHAFQWSVQSPWDEVFAIAANGDLSILDASVLDHETASSMTVPVLATDLQGAVGRQDVLLTITDVDEPPTDVQLTPAVVPEVWRSGSTSVGTLSAVDPEGGTVLFESAHEGFIVQGGNELWIGNGSWFDFETSTEGTIAITVRTVNGVSATVDVPVQISDQPELPTYTWEGPTEIPEALAVDTVLGRFVPHDPEGDSITLDERGCDGHIAVDPVTLIARVADSGAFDFETSPTVSIGCWFEDPVLDWHSYRVDLTLLDTQLEWTGTPGEDVFDGTGEQDELARGLGGADTLSTGAGQDILIGGPGDDILRGGPDVDIYSVGAGDGSDTIDDGEFPVQDILRVTDSDTTVYFSYLDRLASLDLHGNTNVRLGVGPGGGTVYVPMGGDVFQTVVGSESMDIIHLEQAGPVVFGGAGRDQLYGHSGVDTFQYDGPSTDIDLVFGRGGVDRVVALSDDTVLSGNFDGSFTLDAQGHANVVVLTSDSHFGTSTLVGITEIRGTDGDDVIVGTDGDDVIHGGHGADGLAGGAGNDTLSAVGMGTPTSWPSLAGGEGTDTLWVYRTDGTAIELRSNNMSIVPPDLVVSQTANEAILLPESEGRIQISGQGIYTFSGIERVRW